MPASRDGDIYTAAEKTGVTPEEILDFSADVTPAPVPEAVRTALADAAPLLGRYPDPRARVLRRLAAERFGVDPECVTVGNGETEFLYAVPRALRPRRVVIVAPCRHDYWRASDFAGAESEGLLAAESHEFIPQADQIASRLSGVDMAILGNPNNPTGVAVPGEMIRGLAERFPGTTFLVDETYAEFVPEGMGVSAISATLPPNVVVLRTPAPLLGLPGLRIGFMIAQPEFGALVERAREPWSTNALALCAAEALYRNPVDAAAFREPVIAERERVREELSRLTGIRVFRSYTNFLLLKITRPNLDSAEMCRRMLTRKVLIRNAAGFRGLDGKYLRVALRTQPENDLLLQAFRHALDDVQWK